MVRTIFFAALLCATPASATLINGSTQSPALAPQYFTAAQAANSDTNPSFTYSNVPYYGTITVSYGPYFEGQTATDPFSPPTSVSGSPTGPLTLALDEPVQAPPGLSPTDPSFPDYPYSYKTVVEPDATLPNVFVLGGVPGEIGGVDIGVTNGFGGPIAILFSTPVTGVQLTVGSFDSIGQTQIEGFLADGSSIGSVFNTTAGFQTFDLANGAAGQPFAGLLITTTDPGGIGINGVGILQPVAVIVPEPPATFLLGGLILLLTYRRCVTGAKQDRGSAPNPAKGQSLPRRASS